MIPQCLTEAVMRERRAELGHQACIRMQAGRL